MSGQLSYKDFFGNVGGLNFRDTPVRVQDSQATGGVNFDYVQTGGIKSRRGETLINNSADSQLKSIGLGSYSASDQVLKFPVRVAGTKIQSVDLSAITFTNVTSDAATPSSDFVTSGTVQPAVFSQFNTSSANTLWVGGADLTNLVGVYSASKATFNGVPVPTTSVFTATAGAGSSSLSTGTYRYSLVYRKLSTQALSNANTDVSVSVTAGQNVTLAWTLTNNDTTKYDKILVYRSALNGSSLFTTGDLVATLSSSATGYTDTGTSESQSQNIPRAGNTVLDNSVLPSGTYNTIATWKRRLVTANNGTVYISDINKPESWPAANIITVPSGGAITGFGVISFATTQSNDEYLAVFKERELWIITGDSISDWSLKFIDNVGTPVQTLIVNCSGFLGFIDYRGVFIWDGSNKPIYTSGPVEPLFAVDGDIDKTMLRYGFGTFYRKKYEVEWILSNNLYGTNKYCLKLDLRLTLPQVENSLTGRNLDGVFTADSLNQAMYAGLSFLPTTSRDELLLRGDDSGFIYKSYDSFSDAGDAYPFEYLTKFLDASSPTVNKQFHKVIVWVEEVGDWDLLLDYWTSYRADLQSFDTLSEQISTSIGQAASLWDVALWDESYWDSYQAKLKPLVFNLRPGVNNSNQGEVIRLRFRQTGADQPVTITGFTLVYTELGMVK